MIQLTEKAKEKLKFFLQDRSLEEWGIQVQPQGAGNFHFSLVSVKEINEGQKKVVVDGFSVVIPENLQFELEGAKIDYMDAAWSSGFKLHLKKDEAEVKVGRKYNLNREDPFIQQVEVLIKDEINPALAAHGGFVELLGFEEQTAYVKMGGGCQGCGMAGATLRQGIELRLKEEFPQIQEVMDVTKHEEGSTPYYS